LVVAGVAVIVAALLVPGIRLGTGNDEVRAAVSIGVLAIVLAVVNAYLRPILRLVSAPLSLLTLGLSAFVLNALLLLMGAAVADVVLDPPPLRLGGFPPSLDAEALVAALLGSVVIGLATTVMSVLTPDASR
jgi:putative membrane protein